MSHLPPVRTIVFDILLIVVLGCSLEFSYFYRHPNFVAPDTPSYLEPGIRLVNGQGFTSAEPIAYTFPLAGSTGIRPHAIRTPAYPLILGVWDRIGLPFRALVATQHAVNIAVSVSLYGFLLFARRRRSVALMAGGLRAMHLPAIAAANQLLTETLFSAFLIACLFLTYAVARGRLRRPVLTSAFTGALIGIAALVRPVAAFFWLPLAASLLWGPPGHRRRSAVALALTASLITGAWATRNYFAAGRLGLTAVIDECLLFFPAAGAVVLDAQPVRYGVTAYDAQNDFHLRVHRLQPRLFAAGNRAIVQRTGRQPSALTYAARARIYRDLGIDLLWTHPKGTLLLAAGSLMHQFLGELWETATWLGMDYRAAKIRMIPLAAVMLMLALIGSFSFWSSDRALATVLIATVGYFSVVAIGQPGASRYFIPAMIAYVAMVAEGAVVTLGWATRQLRARKKEAGAQAPARF